MSSLPTLIGSTLKKTFSRSGSNSFRQHERDEHGASTPSRNAAQNIDLDPSSTPPPACSSNLCLSRSTSLKRSLTCISTASSVFTRDSLSSLRSDQSTEEKRLEKERARVEEEQKVLLRKIRKFHKAISGAVFYGTVRYANAEMEICTGGVRNYVTNIQPKNPPKSPNSPKHAHFAKFAEFYNDADKNTPLECFFDVFMKQVPAEGARITFLARPSGEEGNYLALGCNIAKQAYHWVDKPGTH